MKLPDDPLTWVLQNPHAVEVLGSLRDGREHLPVDVRKGTGIHPESFRQTLHVLGLYGLVRTRAAKGARWESGPKGRTLKVVVEITPKGARMALFVDQFRDLLRKHVHAFPRATAERWLEA